MRAFARKIALLHIILGSAALLLSLFRPETFALAYTNSLFLASLASIVAGSFLLLLRTDVFERLVQGMKLLYMFSSKTGEYAAGFDQAGARRLAISNPIRSVLLLSGGSLLLISSVLSLLYM